MKTWWVSKSLKEFRLTLIGPFPSPEAAARIICLARTETVILHAPGVAPAYNWRILCDDS